MKSRSKWLLGTVQKMRAGKNVQDKLIVLAIVDKPWILLYVEHTQAVNYKNAINRLYQ